MSVKFPVVQIFVQGYTQQRCSSHRRPLRSRSPNFVFAMDFLHRTSGLFEEC